MKRPLTAQIKPSTRDAIKDQLASAAERIIELKQECGMLERPFSQVMCRDSVVALERSRLRANPIVFGEQSVQVSNGLEWRSSTIPPANPWKRIKRWS